MSILISNFNVRVYFRAYVPVHLRVQMYVVHAHDAHTKRLLTKRLLDKTSPNKTSP